MQHLSDDSLANLAIPVLYNICVDYRRAMTDVLDHLECLQCARASSGSSEIKFFVPRNNSSSRKRIVR